MHSILITHTHAHTHIHRFPKPQEYPIRPRTIHKVQEYQTDRILTYLTHFELWAWSRSTLDLAIIVSSWYAILIFAINILIRGNFLLHLQEYRYCLANNKIWFTYNSSSQENIPNNISLSDSLWILTLWSPSHYLLLSRNSLNSYNIPECA